MFSLNKKSIAYIGAAVIVVAVAATVTGVYLHSRAQSKAPVVSEVIVGGNSTGANGQTTPGTAQAARNNGGAAAAGGTKTAGNNNNTAGGNTGTPAKSNTATTPKGGAKPGTKPVLTKEAKDTVAIDNILHKQPDQIVYVKNGVKKTLTKKDKMFTPLFRYNDLRTRETMFIQTGAQMKSLPGISSAVSAASSVNSSSGYAELEYKYSNPTQTLYFPLTRDASGFSVMALSVTNKDYPANEFKFDCPQILTKRLLAKVQLLP